MAAGHRRESPVGKYSTARWVIAVVMALFLAGTIAGTVGADTERGHNGMVGPHSLRDTQTNPSVKCLYEDQGGPSTFNGRLTWIEVNPPRMKSVPGAGTQDVAWRFIVQRAAYEPGFERGSFRTTYSSDRQTSQATESSNAAFTSRMVHVTVPTGGHYVYRVLVKLIWYEPDNSKQGTATHLADWYRGVATGTSHRRTDGFGCDYRYKIS